MRKSVVIPAVFFGGCMVIQAFNTAVADATIFQKLNRHAFWEVYRSGGVGYTQCTLLTDYVFTDVKLDSKYDYRVAFTKIVFSDKNRRPQLGFGVTAKFESPPTNSYTLEFKDRNIQLSVIKNKSNSYISNLNRDEWNELMNFMLRAAITDPPNAQLIKIYNKRNDEDWQIGMAGWTQNLPYFRKCIGEE